jgi:DNA-directed RNA polymerase subunit RPC12/RpoP
MAKAVADDRLRIDIRVWKRKGFLSEGKRKWNFVNDEGEEVGAISVETQLSRFVLRYNAVEPSGKSEQIEDSISLGQTNGGRGWKRPWFLCPGCGKRVAILYQRKYFRCRRCLGLVYASQRVTPSQRALRRIREIGW